MHSVLTPDVYTEVYGLWVDCGANCFDVCTPLFFKSSSVSDWFGPHWGRHTTNMKGVVFKQFTLG